MESIEIGLVTGVVIRVNPDQTQEDVLRVQKENGRDFVNVKDEEGRLVQINPLHISFLRYPVGVEEQAPSTFASGQPAQGDGGMEHTRPLGY